MWRPPFLFYSCKRRLRGRWFFLGQIFLGFFRGRPLGFEIHILLFWFLRFLFFYFLLGLDLMSSFSSSSSLSFRVSILLPFPCHLEVLMVSWSLFLTLSLLRCVCDLVLILALKVLGSFVVLVHSRLVGPVLLCPHLSLWAHVIAARVVLGSWCWCPRSSLRARVLTVQVVLNSWCWCLCSLLRVRELAVRVVRGSWCWCGRLLWYMVIGSCGLLVPLYSKLGLVCLCLVVIVVTNSYLRPSLLYHSCLFDIVDTGLSATIVNPLWLWSLYQENILGCMLWCLFPCVFTSPFCCAFSRVVSMKHFGRAHAPLLLINAYRHSCLCSRPLLVVHSAALWRGSV